MQALQLTNVHYTYKNQENAISCIHDSIVPVTGNDELVTLNHIFDQSQKLRPQKFVASN